MLPIEQRGLGLWWKLVRIRKSSNRPIVGTPTFGYTNESKRWVIVMAEMLGLAIIIIGSLILGVIYN